MIQRNDSEFGPVIHRYTTEDAIDDGVLVDVSRYLPRQPAPPGILVLTRAVYERLRTVADDRGVDLDAVLRPFLADVMANLFRLVSRDPEEHLWTTPFARLMEGSAAGGTLWAGANEHGGFTVMYPEDY